MEPQATSESERIKHLEFIQATISRLGNNCFVIRGWAVTATGVLLAVAIQGKEWRVAAMVLLIGLGFLILDSSYLRRERMYRQLYNDAIQRDVQIVPIFSMDTQRYALRVKWKDSFLSGTILMIHLPLISTDIATAILLSR
ncbi:hypothetical protein ACGFZS_42090 [Streptomyces sp. NPDC048288]|uniref:hypothetical protein n=1 Tax=Streptomyces sp. NPDC048288 TaxID=3365529 RepID=UPI0037249C2E